MAASLQPTMQAPRNLLLRDIPAEMRPMLGRVTVERTLPRIRRFIEGGGTVITIGGSSTNLARHLKLPVQDHLVENDKPLPESKFFVPGSILTSRLDVSHPLAHGMKEWTDVFFDNSPVFKVAETAAAETMKPVAWFATSTPLKSGWAWGQHYLERGVAVVEARVGDGRVFLFGPEIVKRAQPHGTFKFLFNGIHFASSRPSTQSSNSR